MLLRFLAVLTFALMIGGVDALFGQKSKLDSQFAPVRDAPDTIDNDFTTLQTLPEPLSASLKTLAEFETLPSCNKMATAALLHSCHSLEGPTASDGTARGAEIVLDQAKSMFAARLAVCELIEVGSKPIPDQCTPFVPSKQMAKQNGMSGHIRDGVPSPPVDRYPRYERVTEQHLDACIEGLFADSRTWNSYTNAKQNAIAICQATRASVEKDETIHFYKAMHKLTAVVFNAQSERADEMQALQSAFSTLVSQTTETIEKLHEQDLVREAEMSKKWADYLFKVQRLSQNLDSIQEQASKTNLEVHENGRQASEVFIDHRQMIEDFFIQITKNIDFSHDQLEQMHRRQLHITELMESGIVQKVYSINEDLHATHSIVQELRHDSGLAGDDVLELRRVLTDSGNAVVLLSQDLSILHIEQRQRQLELATAQNESLAAARSVAGELRNMTVFTNFGTLIPVALKQIFAFYNPLQGSVGLVILWLSYLVGSMIILGLLSHYCYLTMVAPLTFCTSVLHSLYNTGWRLPWCVVIATLYYSTHFAFVEGPESTIARYQAWDFGVNDFVIGGTLLATLVLQLSWARLRDGPAHVRHACDLSVGVP